MIHVYKKLLPSQTLLLEGIIKSLHKMQTKSAYIRYLELFAQRACELNNLDAS